MKPWLAMLRVLRKALVSSCSLLLLAAAAGAVDYAEVQRRLEAAPNQAAQDRIYREVGSDPSADQALRNEIRQYLNARDSAYGWTDEGIERAIASHAFIQNSGKITKNVDAAKQAEAIKSNPMYQDSGERESSNWISRAMERFGEALNNMMRGRQQEFDPNITPPNVNLNWLIYVVWGLLGILILIFLFFAARHIQWRNRLRRKATALLEEDEPERTLDEWLAQADLLASQGRHREAVRCLYLACLLRFDEHGIARFIRGETNWEHLGRIERGGKLPSGVDFRRPTEAFDRIWYGFHVRGAEDVALFREWYENLTAELARRAA